MLYEIRNIVMLFNLEPHMQRDVFGNFKFEKMHVNSINPFSLQIRSDSNVKLLFEFYVDLPRFFFFYY